MSLREFHYFNSINNNQFSIYTDKIMVNNKKIKKIILAGNASFDIIVYILGRFVSHELNIFQRHLSSMHETYAYN